MKILLNLRPIWLLILYIFIDALCVGMGMGVPFFCILLGFATGWCAVRYNTSKVGELPQLLGVVLRYCVVAAFITCLAMLILWGPFTSYLFNPSKDIANSGIPMILFEPLPSFIGWMVLMVFISPFLQLLTSLFSAYITLMVWTNKAAHGQKAI